jgi:hypothetical protein
MVMPGIEPRIDNHLVAVNLDIGATIFDLMKIDRESDGISLVPLLKNPNIKWRKDLFIENFALGTQPFIWAGLRTKSEQEEWKYVEYRTGEQELYDLVNDPYEMESKHNDPNYQGIKNHLATRLAGLKGLAITSADPPMGVVNQPYNFTLTAWGGTTPYTWEIVAGELPAGLSLDRASGRIHGIPARVAHRQVTIRVADSGVARYTGNPQDFLRHYNLPVLSGIHAAPLAGATVGVTPTVTRCLNLSTGQTVRIELKGNNTWNCETAGLVAQAGDAVRVTIVYRQIDASSTEIGGTMTGMVPVKATCHNEITGQTVETALDGATAWSCTAAGLIVNPGDRITALVPGIAD